MFFRKIFIVMVMLLGSLSAETIVHNGVTYGTVTSPYTGRVWLDRNLGASQVCTAYNDSACYGDYYQWGRGTDGHEKFNSPTTSTKASSITVGHGNFIKGSGDWTSADGDRKIRQANWNPCPAGYKIPTFNELYAEKINNSADAYSKLKLPSAGYRSYEDGSINAQGDYGFVWESSLYQSFSRRLSFHSVNADYTYSYQTYGYSVRCIKDNSIPPLTSNAGPDQNSTIGQQVRLSASLSGDSDANITSYVWKEGDVVLSTDVNFTKSDFTVGTHTITLTVTDDANNSASDDVLVNVSWSQEAVTDIYLPTTVTSTVQANVEKAYRFTLYDKATLVVDAGETTDVALRGYLYDENGTQVSSIADWSKGKNNQLKIEKTLEAGVYVLKVWGGADAAFSMEVKTYVLDPETAWSAVIKSQYTVHKNKLFTKTFSIQKNIHDANYSNLSVSVAGSTDVRVDVQKKDDKGEDLEEYKYKLVGTLASSEDITLSITDNTESYSVSLPVHLKVGEFAITNVGPSNPFIIANGDDITYPLYAVFDAMVPEGSTVKPRCSINVPWDGRMRAIELEVIKYEDTESRYKCSIHDLWSIDGGPSEYLQAFSTIAHMDELSLDIGFNDTESVYATLKAPIFKRDAFTAKAVLEFVEGVNSEKYNTYYPSYAVVNKRLYAYGPGNMEQVPKVIYLGGERSLYGVRKFDLDEVRLRGGPWRLTYQGHEFFIETFDTEVGFQIYAGNDPTKTSHLAKFIYDPRFNFSMLVKRSTIVRNIGRALDSGILWTTTADAILERESAYKMQIQFKECEIKNSPLVVSQPVSYNFPSISCSSRENTGEQYQDLVAGVRGTTFTINKKKNKPLEFNLFEGEIELAYTYLDENITLQDMEPFDIENMKTKLDAKALDPRQTQYLADTSLAAMDENTSVGSITITSNLSNASYILVGDNVQVGNGKISVFEGVVEGNYKLEFLPVLGYAKPESIHITLSKASLEKSYSVVYKVDTDNDGTPDSLDAFPNNSDESVDTDHDGIGNNADADDDNDGFLDANDDLPLNPNEQTDTDHDGIGNNADTDDDNDGISDTQEIANGLNPLNASDAQADLDHDGFSNAIEISIGTDIHNAKSKPVWAPIMMGDIMSFVPAKK